MYCTAVDAAVWQMRPTTSNCAAPASEEEGRGELYYLYAFGDLRVL